MSPLRSLQNRIFLASALLTVLSTGVALYLVSLRINQEAERALEGDLVATGALVEQLRTTRAETFTMMARLVADAPKLKAAVDTNDPPTVQNVADEYQERLRAHVLVVTNRDGRALAHVGPTEADAASVLSHPAVRDGLAGRERFDLLPATGGIIQLATVPIVLGLERPDVLGTLSVGFLLDDALATELKSVTGSDVAFGMGGRILASTLPADRQADATALLGTSLPRTVTLGSEQFVALALPLSPGDAATPVPATAVILRSRTDQLRFLREIYTELAVTAVLGVLLATFLSFVVARTVTRPLAAITAAMRDVAATGDLTRKIPFRGHRRWQDEDARLLAATFNTLTESIARFQREGAQKERLSSLGRLSTVIAHEIRNPLMIIKSALRALRQSSPSSHVVHEAIADIDGEVVRLNRIVNEVLDFARPIKYALAPTDVNALVKESAAAAQATPGATVHVSTDPAVGVLTTDAERLRLALVNLVVNARQAVRARKTVEPVAPGGGGLAAGPYARPETDAPVVVRTHATQSHVVIAVIDTGPGIEPDDLPRIFDPYFSTKRGGTGLGLPIAKNIVEGLGGSLVVSSFAGRGTEMRLELPRQAPTTSGV